MAAASLASCKIGVVAALILMAVAKEDPTTTPCENCKKEGPIAQGVTEEWAKADIANSVGLAQQVRGQDKATTTPCENCKSGAPVVLQDANIGESVGLLDAASVQGEGAQAGGTSVASVAPWLGLGLLAGVVAMVTLRVRMRMVEACPVSLEEQAGMLEAA